MSLKSKNKRKGFIKIDVEGFEKLVIKQIAESIPKNFSAIIVFENWSNEISLSEIKDFFRISKLDFITMRELAHLIEMMED